MSISGLGFNIRGGTDIPHFKEDTGIFVTKLKEAGAAYRDGRLEEGDKILEVNGHRIQSVTHNEAVQIFITAGETVTSKVQHGAEESIVRELPTEMDNSDKKKANPRKTQDELEPQDADKTTLQKVVQAIQDIRSTRGCSRDQIVSYLLAKRECTIPIGYANVENAIHRGLTLGVLEYASEPGRVQIKKCPSGKQNKAGKNGGK